MIKLNKKLHKSMPRRVIKHKNAIRSIKFNNKCFMIDNQNKYKAEQPYDGVIGEIKKYTAHNKTFRHRATISTQGLYKGDPVKQLTVRLPGKDGRNSNGHITSGHTRTAYRRMYRKIDMYRLSDKAATVLRIEKDPNRSGFIALVKEDITNRIFYIPATLNMKVNQRIESGYNADCVEGNVLPLEKISDGLSISNIEISPKSGTKMVRAAGVSAKLIRKEAGYAYVKLPSGEVRKFLLSCKAYIGHVSNEKHNRIQIGSAGKAFHLGRRPRTRPMAMNHDCHPMGGPGRGHKKSNRNGNMLHGQRTRCPRKTGSLIYTSRHLA